MSDVSLKTQIQGDMKQAMRDKNKVKLGTLRLLHAALRQYEIDQQTELDDAGVLAIVGKLIKQRQDSVAQYQKAERTDLAEQESAEIAVLQDYLPPQLDESEIQARVDAAIQSAGATSMQDMGKVMATLKSTLQGQADMALVSKLVKATLAG